MKTKIVLTVVLGIMVGMMAYNGAINATTTILSIQ
jgi:hypothetical protein